MSIVSSNRKTTINEATVDHQHTHALSDASMEELRFMLAEIRRARALEEGRVIEATATVVE